VPGQVATHSGVTIIGYTDLPSRLPAQASRLYATNIRHLLSDLTPGKDGTAVVNMDDEVIRGATVIKEGTVTWPPPPPRLSAAPKHTPAQPVVEPATIHKPPKTGWGPAVLTVLGALAFAALGAVAPSEFLQHFFVFVLACFVGYRVIWSVTPALHTPLMSVTNAISGIIVLGALLQVKGTGMTTVEILALVAILISTINVAGGFLVTQRMLNMFRK
jgi:NAD(P) transhydrogenase subunit alpha